MPVKIFLSEITKDKYRNEIIIKFPVFSVSHMAKALLEDWPTMKVCFSEISGEDLAGLLEGLPEPIECIFNNLHLCAFLL